MQHALAATSLYQLWRTADAAETPHIAAQLPVPGIISMRCRYELLAGGSTVGAPRALFDITEEQWNTELDLFDHAEGALQSNDSASARASFRKLIDSHDPQRHPLPAIEARIGMGDADRQDERISPALRHYAAALDEAHACGYRYGQVRAAIPLGYLHLRVGSAESACDEFLAAEELARQHDWRLDRANALTGLGEAHHLLHEPVKAFKALLNALSIYEALQSHEGIANATVQLGETCRRLGWLEDAKGWYRQAIAAAAGLPVALSNAWDGLGEAHLADGDGEAAIAAHTTALSTAGSGYPRGRAHAIHGLARCAVHAEEWHSAIPHFSDAADLYREINDVTSAASAESGLGRSYEALGDLELALRHRLAAVELIETARASQAAHAQQGEYFARFSTTHEMALRTAVVACDPAAFVVVFESLAGRRLAGLMADIAEGFYGPQGLGRMVLEAESPVNHRRLLTRTLNDVGLRHDATGTGTDAFDETLAGLYSPFDPSDVEELWTRVETGEAYVLLIVALHRLEMLAWLLKPPEEGLVHIGLSDLSGRVAEIVNSLHSKGLPLDAVPDDLAALGALISDEALELIARDAPLVVVPAGQLWAVPWTAVPVSDTEYLGERNPLSVAPSLTAVAHSCGGLREPAGPTTAHWRSPLVSQHRLNVFAEADASTVAIETATECQSAILHAEHDLVVVLSHGRPTGGLAHYLELDEHVSLTAADMVSAEPPPALALIACWGAHAPGQGWGDPLSIATLALARNSRRIAATVSELLDDAPSSRFVNMFLNYAQLQPMPQALQRATRRWLSQPDYRNGYLSRWAPLVIVGTW